MWFASGYNKEIKQLMPLLTNTLKVEQTMSNSVRCVHQLAIKMVRKYLTYINI